MLKGSRSLPAPATGGEGRQEVRLRRSAPLPLHRGEVLVEKKRFEVPVTLSSRQTQRSIDSVSRRTSSSEMHKLPRSNPSSTEPPPPPATPTALPVKTPSLEGSEPPEPRSIPSAVHSASLPSAGPSDQPSNPEADQELVRARRSFAETEQQRLSKINPETMTKRLSLPPSSRSTSESDPLPPLPPPPPPQRPLGTPEVKEIAQETVKQYTKQHTNLATETRECRQALGELQVMCNQVDHEVAKMKEEKRRVKPWKQSVSRLSPPAPEKRRRNGNGVRHQIYEEVEGQDDEDYHNRLLTKIRQSASASGDMHLDTADATWAAAILRKREAHTEEDLVSSLAKKHNKLNDKQKTHETRLYELLKENQKQQQRFVETVLEKQQEQVKGYFKEHQTTMGKQNMQKMERELEHQERRYEDQQQMVYILMQEQRAQMQQLINGGIVGGKRDLSQMHSAQAPAMDTELGGPATAPIPAPASAHEEIYFDDANQGLIKRLEETIVERDTVITNLKHEITKMSELEIENETQGTKNKEHLVEISRLRDDIDTLKSRLKREQGTDEKLRTANAKIRELQQQIDDLVYEHEQALAEEAAKLGRSHKEAETLLKENRDQDVRFAEERETNKSLASKVAEYEVQVRQLSGLQDVQFANQQEVLDERHKNRQLNSQLKQLQASLQAQRHDHQTQLQTTQHEGEQRFQELELRMSQMQHEFELKERKFALAAKMEAQQEEHIKSLAEDKVEVLKKQYEKEVKQVRLEMHQQRLQQEEEQKTQKLMLQQLRAEHAEEVTALQTRHQEQQDEAQQQTRDALEAQGKHVLQLQQKLNENEQQLQLQEQHSFESPKRPLEMQGDFISLEEHRQEMQRVAADADYQVQQCHSELFTIKQQMEQEVHEQKCLIQRLKDSNQQEINFELQQLKVRLDGHYENEVRIATSTMQEEHDKQIKQVRKTLEQQYQEEVRLVEEKYKLQLAYMDDQVVKDQQTKAGQAKQLLEAQEALNHTTKAHDVQTVKANTERALLLLEQEQVQKQMEIQDEANTNQMELMTKAYSLQMQSKKPIPGVSVGVGNGSVPGVGIGVGVGTPVSAYSRGNSPLFSFDMSKVHPSSRSASGSRSSSGNGLPPRAQSIRSGSSGFSSAPSVPSAPRSGMSTHSQSVAEPERSTPSSQEDKHPYLKTLPVLADLPVRKEPTPRPAFLTTTYKTPNDPEWDRQVGSVFVYAGTQLDDGSSEATDERRMSRQTTEAEEDELIRVARRRRLSQQIQQDSNVTEDLGPLITAAVEHIHPEDEKLDDSGSRVSEFV
eukprot:TRINITY_DN13442_c0_g1_i3.p1 TRINITY_DN13442_c0_g1~~TRINITY_DN13442_c0_g1_i3.p1  ORF type:complete len:1292 (+),score=360.83 TRINITY_DN13442_c0_g1_i3:210-4085(+)